MININLSETIKALWYGISLGFGLVWAMIKMVPWWIWIMLIVLKIVETILTGERRGRYFRFPGRRYSDAKTYIDENGYRRFTDSDKLVSRWVAEKKTGRKIDPEEVVHHRNEDKLDNRPSNLEVLPNQEIHDEIHGYDPLDDEEGGDEAFDE